MDAVAAPAVPRLIRLLEEDSHEDVRHFAAVASSRRLITVLIATPELGIDAIVIRS